MINLAERCRCPELMDDPSQPRLEIETALSALSKMNTLSLSAHNMSQSILQLLGSRKHVRILDLGSGGGDILCSIVQCLARLKIRAHGTGVDTNEHSVRFATEHACRRGVPVEFYLYSALAATEDLDYDIVISSLFLHHLDTLELAQLFQNVFRRAKIGMVMTDLNRSIISYAIVWATTKIISSSQMVRQDGLTSVMGALTAKEFRALGLKAGMTNIKIKPTFPCRLMITWSRHQPEEE